MGRAWTRSWCWQLLDAGAEHPEIEQLLDDLLAIAQGGAPEHDRPVDLSQPGARLLLERHRVIPVVPLDAVDDGSRDWLRRRQIEIRAAQLGLDREATWVLEALDHASVETRVLKGLATAELDHADRRTRHSGDLDLAVAPAEIDHAVTVLESHGCTELPTPFDPVLWYGRTLTTPNGVEIDLHTRLFRRSPLGSSLVDEPGAPLSALPGVALPTEHRLVHAAGHFIISPPGTRRMNGFLDIARLLERADLDLDRARQVAAALHVESLVGAGIRVEAELSGRERVLRRLTDWAPPDWLERRTRLVPHRRYALDHLGRYREVPAGHRLEYLPTWLLPSARQRDLFRRSVRRATTRAIGRARRRGRLSS